MTIAGRPLATKAVAGQVLDDAFARWRMNFKAIALLTLMMSGTVNILLFLHTTSSVVRITPSGQLLVNDVDTYTSVIGLLTLLGFIFTTLLSAFITHLLIRAWQGKPVDLTAVVNASLRRIFPYLGMLFLASLIGVVGLVVVVILGQAGIVMAAVGVLILYVIMLPLVHAPAIFWAGRTAGESISGSYELTRTRFWKVFGATSVGIVILTILRLGAASLILAVFTTQSVPVYASINAVAGLLSDIVGLPLLAALSVSLYIDGIIMTQGYDIRRMISDLPPVTGPLGADGAPPAWPAPPPPPPGARPRSAPPPAPPPPDEPAPGL